MRVSIQGLNACISEYNSINKNFSTGTGLENRVEVLKNRISKLEQLELRTKSHVSQFMQDSVLRVKARIWSVFGQRTNEEMVAAKAEKIITNIKADLNYLKGLVNHLIVTKPIIKPIENPIQNIEFPSVYGFILGDNLAVKKWKQEKKEIAEQLPASEPQKKKVFQILDDEFKNLHWKNLSNSQRKELAGKLLELIISGEEYHFNKVNTLLNNFINLS